MVAFSRLPHGVDEWLVAYCLEVEQENVILRENSADRQVAAREAMLKKLVEHATAYYHAEIGTGEAAEILGVNEETVRRRVRSGDLPDGRENPRGHHKIKRGAVRAQRAGMKEYDPLADAQEVARLRRSAA
jgi:hypothetical protein